MPATPTGQTDYKAVGAAINTAGWQQFSFVRGEDHSAVLDEGQIVLGHNDRLLVVSHSCDLIHHSEQETTAELLVLERLAEGFKEEPTHQSPRMRIVAAYDVGQATSTRFLARAPRRIWIPRVRLMTITPDLTISLRSPQDVQGLRGSSERHMCDWLAGRYNRGWTPSEFDRRLKLNIGPIQKSLSRMRELGVDEIFIRVTPEMELPAEEAYEVSLVVLADPEMEDNLVAIKGEAKSLGQAINKHATLAVVGPPTVDLSTNIGYGSVKGWLRFQDVFRDSLAATPAEPTVKSVTAGGGG